LSKQVAYFPSPCGRRCFRRAKADQGQQHNEAARSLTRLAAARIGDPPSPVRSFCTITTSCTNSRAAAASTRAVVVACGLRCTSSTVRSSWRITTGAGTRVHVVDDQGRDHVRSRGRGDVNEVLCNIVCHNNSCLIQESYELGIDTSFGTQRRGIVMPTESDYELDLQANGAAIYHAPCQTRRKPHR
jgi:hypothetical protein